MDDCLLCGPPTPLGFAAFCFWTERICFLVTTLLTLMSEENHQCPTYGNDAKTAAMCLLTKSLTLVINTLKYILWRNIMSLSILLALNLSCTPAKLVLSEASFILGAYPQWDSVLCDSVKFLFFFWQLQSVAFFTTIPTVLLVCETLPLG